MGTDIDVYVLYSLRQPCEYITQVMHADYQFVFCIYI